MTSSRRQAEPYNAGLDKENHNLVFRVLLPGTSVLGVARSGKERKGYHREK